MGKRVFLIVLDSFGVGAAPDADVFGDVGSDTLGAVRKDEKFNCPNLKKLGLFNIEGIDGGTANPNSAYAKMQELSMGKDTTIGHWEIAGIVSSQPMPVFPDGFPAEVINKLEQSIGSKVLCNKVYSGTEVIKDYGAEHMKTGCPIVYTSADSVMQIAAHEKVIPVERLYDICGKARKIMTGKYGVGRIIARPFIGEYPYQRTANRHDFSLLPPSDTMLDIIKDGGLDVISVGKIVDIFAGRGITEFYRTIDNKDGMRVTDEMVKRNFNGLCFINLVDFDMKFGHRNDVSGYANALSEFDEWLGDFLPKLKDDDILIITADHGCDPSTPSTDHSREYTPMILFGSRIKSVNLGVREGFSDISATVLEYFSLNHRETKGSSFLGECLKSE